MRRAAAALSLLLMLSWALAAPARAETPEAALARAEKKFSRLAAAPAKKTDRRSMEGVARDAARAAERKPALLDRALYLQGRVSQRLFEAGGRREDFDTALARYRAVVSDHPKSPLADDAQYHLGELYCRSDPGQAYLEFAKVCILFPEGDAAKKARRRADEMKGKVGKGKAAPASARQKTAPPPPSAPAGAAGRIESVRAWTSDSSARVALYTSVPVTFERHVLPADAKGGKAARVALDVRGAVPSPRLRSVIEAKDRYLRTIRFERASPDVTRVVFETEAVVDVRVVPMADPFRLVVDITGKRAEKAPRGVAAPAPQPAPAPQGENLAGGGAAPPPAPAAPPAVRRGKKGSKAVAPGGISLARQLGLGVSRIVLDPGHGGKDKGATGANGVYEKDLTLALALALKPVLERDLGCEVFLTRTRDVFVPLEERTAIANMKKADLFISLHCNAHRNPAVRGFETYYLNLSTDKETAALAAFENATSQKHVSDLESILHNLMTNTKMDESARLARDVHKTMVARVATGYKDVRDLGVKQGPFYVLLGADMPSILVETTFISNETEARLMTEQAFRETLAQGIAQGIAGYVHSMKNLAQARN